MKNKNFWPCEKCRLSQTKAVGKPRYSRCGDEVVVAQVYRYTYACKKCGKNIVEDMDVSD